MISNNFFKLLMDDCEICQKSASGKLQLNICELAGNMAYHAIMLEIHLTPKAGLIDCSSESIQEKIDIDTSIASANVLRTYMKEFVQTGMEMKHKEAWHLFPALQEVGLKAEKDVLKAASGKISQRGMIFTLGLICGAVGWLFGRKRSFDAVQIRRVITFCCAPLTAGQQGSSVTGNSCYKKVSGVQTEAAQGYPTIFHHALPAYEKSIEAGQSEEQALSKTLLVLMANSHDTSIIKQGGLEGLAYVQDYAFDMLLHPSTTDVEFEKKILAFDRELKQKKLCPEGSAVLLAATWLLAQLNICNERI
ncbi:triphosphoribosyl-dephospho-CoA synthase [Vibrio salinus]|uniref:triphosphoribosyl-dephospho-CoA synthase n=1 Tax=Vibrio salinus TaxID=2899784 RepID=UPI001E602DDD|nr:triphosphoribosyl-dephospho-CoA synthase [Vibrio salinus]MCE0492792.1 triphosphoribosyl-dephospho-CoA synthase [Vibrio salinus]